MKGSLRGNKSDWRRLGKILGVSQAGRESMQGGFSLGRASFEGRDCEGVSQEWIPGRCEAVREGVKT